MTNEMFPALPLKTANPAPPRPANSVRRTSSVDVFWPDGPDNDPLFVGTARDYRTAASGHPGEVLAQARFETRLDEDRTILSISADPAPPHLETLVGLRAGRHLRLALNERMPQLAAQADPLYLPIDDLSGCAIVSGFALQQWSPDQDPLGRLSEEEKEALRASRTNVCWGLAEGNSAVRAEGPPPTVGQANAGSLRHPDDPEGWHALPAGDGPAFRRARRIDVSRDEETGVVHIDSAFQDSAALPQGGRMAIHEYVVRATADRKTLEILSLVTEPRILPFEECPGAALNAQRLVGRRLPDLREEVPELLRRTEGCTHLNDALRALADVPQLASLLDTLQPSAG